MSYQGVMTCSSVETRRRLHMFTLTSVCRTIKHKATVVCGAWLLYVIVVPLLHEEHATHLEGMQRKHVLNLNILGTNDSASTFLCVVLLLSAKPEEYRISKRHAIRDRTSEREAGISLTKCQGLWWQRLQS